MLHKTAHTKDFLVLKGSFWLCLKIIGFMHILKGIPSAPPVTHLHRSCSAAGVLTVKTKLVDKNYHHIPSLQIFYPLNHL